MIIAVDFDGTLCEDIYPDIGCPNMWLIEQLKQFRAADEANRLILWTCRADEDLNRAVDWCANYGLYFDALNDNVIEHIQKYDFNTRKVFADLYIDDKCIDWRCYDNK